MNKLRKCHARIPGEHLLNGMIKRVGVNALAVYTILALHQNWITHLSFPSQKTITTLTGLDHKTIQKAIKILAKEKYITFEYRKARNKNDEEYGRKRYFYTLL